MIIYKRRIGIRFVIFGPVFCSVQDFDGAVFFDYLRNGGKKEIERFRRRESRRRKGKRRRRRRSLRRRKERRREKVDKDEEAKKQRKEWDESKRRRWNDLCSSRL